MSLIAISLFNLNLAPGGGVELQQPLPPSMHSSKYGKGHQRYGVLGYLPEPGSRESALWDLNRARSPLLRLPPEIREQIYRLLLAARRIHVRHDPRTSTFHCVALRPAANPWDHGTRHVLSRGLTLLVRVCRQLYHETELLPYRECAWSWQTPGLMERYLLTERRMGLAQRRAVREVCVRGVRGFGNLSRRVRGVLGGLEVVWFWEGKGRGQRGEADDGLGGWVCEVVERRRVDVGVGRPN